jgi:F-box and WD-40 domain protein 1/11
MVIATLDYYGTWIITGSSDTTVGVFDGAIGSKVATLEGHDQLVRSVQAKIYDFSPFESSVKTSDEPTFNFRRGSKIVSGS